MRLISATHLGLIARLPAGICYADCSVPFLEDGCDCLPYFYL